MREEMGSVVEIFSATVGSSGLPRPVVKSLELIEGYGIKDDKFADDDLDKSVMIVGQNSYDIAKKNSIDLLPGSYGENVLLSFDPHTLNIGTILKIGNTTVEITEKCTICDHLSVFSPKLPRLIKKHRGMYCKILKGGQITTELLVTI